MKERIDILLQRQLGVSRSKAQGLIQTGQVFGPGGARLDKAGLRLADDTVLDVRKQPRFVSRGGDKLEAAFTAFPLDVSGLVAIDVGASTGGFTDCLLQHDAAKVYAVDVGYGQLAWKLRQDPRVAVFERCNIRHMKPEQLEEPPAFFVVDCSFISLRIVLPSLVPLLANRAEGIVLIKPQFEAGAHQVGKGGVVRDAAVHGRVMDEIRETAKELGLETLDMAPSPLLGPAGNREFLAHLRREAT